MNKVLLYIALLFSTTGFSQEVIQGKILDQDTKAPMPFAFLIKKSTNKGAITNTDGFFNLLCDPSDTVTISYVGYESAIVPVSYFLTDSIFYLKEKASMLASVNVVGKVDLSKYLKAFKKAKKNLVASKPYESKAYFTLESSHEDRPIELLECYYNAELHNQGIKQLKLKNGRIGLAELETSYFVSLHTTYVMERFNLLYKSNSEFPFNPLHFPLRKIKQLYTIKLFSLTDDIFALEFIPKEQNMELFYSKIWVDQKLQHIVKIEVSQSNLKKHPFVEVDAGHKMDSLNFRMMYSFDNSDRQLLNKIEFDYDFYYFNTVTERRIGTQGVFLFYEKDTLFNLPYNSLKESSLSDYDRIVNQPHNPKFWDYNEVLSPSQKVMQTRAFFEQHGLLLNFSKLALFNSVFKNRIMAWNANRFRLYDINGDRNYQLSPEKLDISNKAIIRSQLYEFSYGIYLDRNDINDSTFYTSSTLINFESSFYYLKTNRFTESLINMVFDIVEIENRKMINTLNSQNWSLTQVDSIYMLTNRNAKRNVNQFIKKTEHGKEEENMLTYIHEIDSVLGVQNERLVRSTFSMHEDELADYYIKEVYNIGNALLELRKFEVALNVLKIGEYFGDTNPWVYYNLGICYFELDEIDLACENFKKAKENGETIDKIFADLCR